MEKVGFWKIIKRTILFAFLAAIVIALFTVPGADKHQKALEPVYQEAMKDASADQAIRQQLEDSIVAVASKGVDEGVNEGIKTALDHYLADPATYAAMAASESQRNQIYEKVKNEVLTKVIDRTHKELKDYFSHDTTSKLRTFVYGELSKDLQTALTEAVIDNKLETTNYFLFSVGSVQKNGKNHWLSIGVFGHVFTFDKAKLRKLLIGQ